MSHGTVYCITNPSMPDIVKIGMTSRSVEERLEEANHNSTWTPTPYRIEFAKFVASAEVREKTLHRIFHSQRVSPRREWFRLPVETVRLHFELMDGPWWAEAPGETPSSTPASQANVLEFLNETLYPSDGPCSEWACVEWTDVVKAFQEWKKQKGYFHGNMTDLRTALVKQYGRPPWTEIRLKMDTSL